MIGRGVPPSENDPSKTPNILSDATQLMMSSLQPVGPITVIFRSITKAKVGFPFQCYKSLLVQYNGSPHHLQPV
jgi:hypothetical protein